jgi:hypothetical protein
MHIGLRTYLPALTSNMRYLVLCSAPPAAQQANSEGNDIKTNARCFSFARIASASTDGGKGDFDDEKLECVELTPMPATALDALYRPWFRRAARMWQRRYRRSRRLPQLLRRRSSASQRLPRHPRAPGRRLRAAPRAP